MPPRRTSPTSRGASPAVEATADHADLIARIDRDNLPRHIAIILDGNGRWAKARGLSRSRGHRAGGENLTRQIDFFLELGIPVVSLYAFSTENWKRPAREVNAIWKLFNEFFDRHLTHCVEKEIRVHASGNLAKLPAPSRRQIQKAVQRTAEFSRLTANFCVNYGSQNEILQAASAVLKDRLALQAAGQARKAAAPIQQAEFERQLYTHPLPPVDLLIRPGGESRISNFLLWQCAYSEIYVTDTLWPDFNEESLVEAIAWFQGRHRRFGGL
ncbi:MAG: polyprenyl diphosphate synthase [Leptospirales bacterium]|jgi:undecaprenyl diphosphate synthase